MDFEGLKREIRQLAEQVSRLEQKLENSWSSYPLETRDILKRVSEIPVSSQLGQGYWADWWSSGWDDEFERRTAEQTIAAKSLIYLGLYLNSSVETALKRRLASTAWAHLQNHGANWVRIEMSWNEEMLHRWQDLAYPIRADWMDAAVETEKAKWPAWMLGSVGLPKTRNL